jgi:hypothetical protein
MPMEIANSFLVTIIDSMESVPYGRHSVDL